MAKVFCLSKQLADRLKAAAIRGEINLTEMYKMSSEERSALFQKYVDKDTAQMLNGGFEEAMISNQKTALKNWTEKTFTGKEKTKGVKSDIFDKIDRLDQLGVLTPTNIKTYLSDMVAQNLGVTATAQEAATISEKSKELQELRKTESKFGTPTMEYFAKRNEIEDYIKSLTPSSRLKVLTSVIGRGTMLFSLKSPLLNIESNTVQAFLTAAERRFNGIEITKDGNKVKISGNLIGVNGQYAQEYMKFVNQVFQKSGYDVSRMMTIKGEQMIRGEEITTAEGKGSVRKVGRFYEDIVFKQLMGAPDVAFSSFHFSDSANLYSTKIAKSEGLKGTELNKRALELFQDSTRIDPKSKEGVRIRDQAIADAQYATYTNKSWASDLGLKIRGILNSLSGDIMLGDQLMPFVKTPANVIKTGLDYSGVTLPIDVVYRAVKVIQDIKSGTDIKTATLERFNGVARTFIRAGLGMTLAHIIASLFDPEDYIGEYPTTQKEQELLELKNATTNSVRIGNKWISLDYFGALGAPLVGMLSAKKYGKGDVANTIFNYYTGVGKQAIKLPGLEIAKDLYANINSAKWNTAKENLFALEKSLVDYARSRTIPAFISDIAKVLDPFERAVDTKSLIGPIISNIPWLRQTLPQKKTVFGEPVKTEGFSQMLFGSRVKTAQSDQVIDEMVRLEGAGELPSITDYAKSSPKFKELKVQIGEDRFIEAQDYLGTELFKAFDRKVTSYSYKRLTDEKKASELNSIKTDLLDKTLRKFGYKAPKK